jgi:hypothetical protein
VGKLRATAVLTPLVVNVNLIYNTNKEKVYNARGMIFIPNQVIYPKHIEFQGWE